jgi:hypothetical protein
VRLGLVALAARTADVYRHRTMRTCTACPR